MSGLSPDYLSECGWYLYGDIGHDDVAKLGFVHADGGRGADAGDSPSEEELPPGRAGSTRAPIGRSHQLLGVGVGVMSMCMSPPS